MDPVTLALAKSYSNSVASPRAVVPLDVPTFDGNPSATHPSVVFVPEGWKGYRYWMAFTPHPPYPREKPSIVASNDLVKWVVPHGLTNPIVSQEEIEQHGFEFSSDPELVLLPDGRMACYYRLARRSGTVGAASRDAIFRKTSSDGVRWSQQELVIDGGSTLDEKLLSPAIVVEPDGTFKMWVVAYDGDSLALYRYTSTDGMNWIDPKLCTWPSGVMAWHPHVVRVNDQYHMLMNGHIRGRYRLFYWKSDDGLAWRGSEQPYPRTGSIWDEHGHYRSALIPVPGEPLKFDVIATGLNNDQTVHRLVLFKGVTFKETRPRSYFFPATSFRPLNEGPEWHVTPDEYAGWLLPAAANRKVGTYIHWSHPRLDYEREDVRAKVKLYVVKLDEGAGNITLWGYFRHLQGGHPIGSPVAASVSVDAIDLDTNNISVLEVVRSPVSFAFSVDKKYTFIVSRAYASGHFPKPVLFVGMELEFS